eukprot:362860-Chlamydomonas_euryale.AAC.6
MAERHITQEDGQVRVHGLYAKGHGTDAQLQAYICASMHAHVGPASRHACMHACVPLPRV